MVTVNYLTSIFTRRHPFKSVVNDHVNILPVHHSVESHRLARDRCLAMGGMRTTARAGPILTVS